MLVRGVWLMTMEGQHSYACKWAPLDALGSSGILEETIFRMHTSASYIAKNCGYRFSMRPCIARALICIYICEKFSMTVRLRHVYGCDGRMLKQKKTFDDKLWIKRSCWIAELLFLTHFWSLDSYGKFFLGTLWSHSKSFVEIFWNLK